MEKKDAYRSIPKMDVILGRDELTSLPLRQEIIKKAVEDELIKLRDSIKKGITQKSPSAQEIAVRCCSSSDRSYRNRVKAHDKCDRCHGLYESRKGAAFLIRPYGHA